MISLKREESNSYNFLEALVDVRFKIPTAAEAEELLEEQLKDTELFKKYVLNVRSEGIEGWENGIDPATVVESPATLGLVRIVALDIVNSIKVDVSRKK